MGLFTSKTKCRRCGAGTCRCAAIARQDTARATKNRAPKVCGGRLRNGGTCHRTVDHGAHCSNPGH